MVNAYGNNPLLFMYTLLCMSLLSLLLVFVNFMLNKLVKSKTSLDYKKYNKSSETYELSVNSMSTMNTINTSQSLMLALLFLLFNMKMTLLVPMILSMQTLGLNKQSLVIMYMMFMMMSVYMKITSNMMTFYKSKKTKYIL